MTTSQKIINPRQTAVRPANQLNKTDRKAVVVLPAYNAEKTLVQTVSAIPHDVVDEIILVDDGSHDETALLAKEMGLTVFEHRKNGGYGANQKTCYKKALEAGADIVVMLHPDSQYDPKIIKYFVELISDGYFDVMLGSRVRSRQETLAGGMPPYKYFANRFLTLIENISTGQNLSEWHTGMRAYTREVLESVDYTKNSDNFVFDTEMLFKIVERGYRIGEISVPVRYLEDSSSISFKNSVKYGLGTLRITLIHLLNRLRIWKNFSHPKSKDTF